MFQVSMHNVFKALDDFKMDAPTNYSKVVSSRFF